jgi:hypothetical protein
MTRGADALAAAIDHAADELCTAIRAEFTATEAAAEWLEAETLRLVGCQNAVTGRQHSAYSAEKAARRSDGYRALQRARVEVECTRIQAAATLETVIVKARFAAAVVEVHA